LGYGSSRNRVTEFISRGGIIIEIVPVAKPSSVGYQDGVADTHQDVTVLMIFLDMHQLVESTDYVKTIEEKGPFQPC
jgi:hypothetical protein